MPISKSGLEVIKRFICSTQLGMTFIMLIVGTLTFISMINKTSESLKGMTRVCAIYRTILGCYENLIRFDLFIYFSRRSDKSILFSILVLSAVEISYLFDLNMKTVL